MDTSELEGEVDHSFFDSDCDEPGDGKKETGRSLEAENKSLPTHQSLYAATTAASFPRTDETENESKEYPDQVEDDLCSEAESKGSINLSREEDWSRASSALSMASSSQKVIDVGSDNEDSNWHSKKSSGTFMAFLAETSDAEDKDMYHQSSNENLEETLPSHPTYVGSGERNETSHRKLIAKQCYQSPSRTSGEASADSESRSSSERLSTPRSRKSSSSLSKFRTSFSSQDLPPHHTSKDMELNVSPVSFGGVSPPVSSQGVDQSAKTQQEGSAPSSGLNNIHQEDDSYADLDECSVRLDSQLGEKLLLHYPGRRTRKNFSFSNDEVRRIDRENQRLLRELSRLTTRPRSVVGPRSKASNDFVRPSHSALNRQRDQRRIESENQAFLKRLDSVKPTPGLRRLDQLANYQRQIGYLGGLPSHPMLLSSQRKESYTLDASRR